MPTMIQTVQGRVTGIWGVARIRGADAPATSVAENVSGESFMVGPFVLWLKLRGGDWRDRTDVAVMQVVAKYRIFVGRRQAGLRS